ncbi:CBS domain [Halanaeroarchaeum sp. HSR-CO]|uniref:CBS domain-containing protein n=1 Tax=Halanaeroarchaeum sp. HSR-CO TaxID=2866382 RepID=UPI00217D5BB0|nr:CBS domain-containing protein [Halanaeroarchaeum sp. HSR-CO]UWG48931.1 CBS domain [Halanaeroarchaeum sp. HSR-CO]
MEDIFVGRLMSSPVHSVSRDTPVQEAAQTMIDADIGSLVVLDEDGALDGILTSTDFVRAAADGGSSDEAVVGEYCTDTVTTTDANDTIRDVADIMIEHGFHHVPVTEGQEPVGMITTSDMTAYVSHIEKPSPPA